MRSRVFALWLALLLPSLSFAVDYAPRIQTLVAQFEKGSPEEQTDAALELSGLPHFALSALEKIEKEPHGEGTAKRLKQALLLVRARQLAADKRAKDGKWGLETTVGAYKTSGRKDPRWDALAIAALERAAAEWNAIPWEAGDRPGAIEALNAAVAAGCDDPLIAYALCRLEKGTPEDYKRAAAGLKDSAYPVVRKYAAMVYAAEALVKSDPAEAGRLYMEALKLLPEEAADQRIPFSTKYSAGLSLRKTGRILYKDSFAGYQLIEKTLEPLAETNALPHALKGEFYAQYAWEARGAGLPGTVADEGWKKFETRLSVARTALEKAYALAPSENQAANMMLTIELGDSKGRDVMETWFMRAVFAAPYDNAPCMSKLFWLQPQWHGSEEQMLLFARSCLKTKNVIGSWNRVILYLHEMRSKDTGEGDAYFRRYSFWKDVRDAFEQELEVFPTRVTQRSLLANYACKAGDYDYANKQFELLGEKPDAEVFGGTKKYNELRKKAKDRIQTPVPALTRVDEKLAVTKATFGAGNKKRNVTEELQMLLENDPMGLIFAGTEQFGDPAPNQRKQLQFEYTLGGKTHSFSLTEGDPFLLPGYAKGIPVENKAFKIVAARWIGQNGKTLDATEHMRKLITTPTVIVPIGTELCGGDPSPNQPKKLVLWVDYDGRRFMKWYAEGKTTLLEP